MRIEAREGYAEITRMRTREQVEAERKKVAKRAEDARNSNPQGEVERHERAVAVLDWVLGEDDTKPSEEAKHEEPAQETR